MTQLIGEIIEVSTTSFVAQCFDTTDDSGPKLPEPPPFGSFVKILEARAVANVLDEEEDYFASTKPLDPNATYALVCHTRTSSLAPGRRPVALGLESEEEMRLQQPQIFELLTTEFSGMLIGYTLADRRPRRHLPPVPPKIHSRVLACDPFDVRALTHDVSFLRSVLTPAGNSACQAPPEALAAACLRAGWTARGEDDDFLLQAGRKLLELLGDDYERLQAIMASVID